MSVLVAWQAAKVNYSSGQEEGAMAGLAQSAQEAMVQISVGFAWETPGGDLQALLEGGGLLFYASVSVHFHLSALGHESCPRQQGT